MAPTATWFNPLDPAVRAAPYAHYAELRAQGRAHRNPLGMVVLTRYADIVPALRDPQRLSNDVDGLATTPRFQDIARRDARALSPLAQHSLLNLDPPDHTRLRRLAAQAFTPRAVVALRPRIEAVTKGLLDHIEARTADGEVVDIVSDLAFPLPFVVISELLGMPLADTERLRSWSHALTRTLEPMATPDDLVAAASAALAMTDYVRTVVDDRRRQPGNDVLSGLIAAEEAGDSLTTDELIATVMLLYVAGHETTVNLIGNGLLALVRHPDELAAWRADPAIGPGAVEELLRYDGPVQFTARVAAEPLALAEEEVAAGDVVLLLVGSANHDPDRFVDPDRLSSRRADAAAHLAFAGGIHYCLGAALARAEAQVALGSLISRFAHIELAAEPIWSDRITLRGLASLPIHCS